MKAYIDAYIKDHELAWSKSTQKSERYRLAPLAEFLNGDPELLWEKIQGYKPYTRNTVWVRVTDFWGWVHKGEAINPYAIWREKNARQFKNTYQRKTPKISYEEARARIETIPDGRIRNKAYQLLFAGLRWAESLSLSAGSSSVLGKGNKVRDIVVPEITGEIYDGPYWNFWKALTDVGLKPHDLRKIRATDLLRKGMDLPTLCETMGWSRMDTAMSYLAPLQKEQREKFFK